MLLPVPLHVLRYTTLALCTAFFLVFRRFVRQVESVHLPFQLNTPKVRSFSVALSGVFSSGHISLQSVATIERVSVPMGIRGGFQSSFRHSFLWRVCFHFICIYTVLS